MKRSIRSPFLLLAVLVLLGSALAWSQSDESLGDVARKSKEKAAATKKPAVVITNDDIPASTSISDSSSSTSSATTAAAAGDSKDAKPAADAKDAKPGTPEDAAKAEERKAALKKADDYDRDAKNLESGYKQLQEKYNNETDSFRKMVLENELANSKDNVDALHKKAADLRAEAQGGGSTPQGQAPPADQQPSQPPQ